MGTVTLAFGPKVAGLNSAISDGLDLTYSIATKVARVGNSIKANPSSRVIGICQDFQLVRVSHTGEALHDIKC